MYPRARSLRGLCRLAAAVVITGFGPIAAADVVPSSADEGLRFEPPSLASPSGAFIVSGLSPERLQELRRDSRLEVPQALLTVAVLRSDGSVGPPLLGVHEWSESGVRFLPRFPLSPGVSYRATVSAMSGLDGARTLDISIPSAKTSPTARVTAVYPSGEVLPENLLKFYIHFSEPMRRGQAYQRVHLIRSNGEAVPDPFLELGEELWDPQGTRFTLLFDPGRIKRGLKPREEVGPALEEGETYRLVVDGDWLDAAGQPLRESFSKTFRVTSPDDDSPDFARWGILAPPAGTRTPLQVRFPEPLDHAMLERVLLVRVAGGGDLSGVVKVSAGETLWEFLPDDVWRAGNYRLEVDSQLEDRAGNSLERPFEVDVFRAIERSNVPGVVEVPFEVAAP
jgi:hypothetical protein